VIVYNSKRTEKLMGLLAGMALGVLAGLALVMIFAR
jgi:hypothetical protein